MLGVSGVAGEEVEDMKGNMVVVSLEKKVVVIQE